MKLYPVSHGIPFHRSQYVQQHHGQDRASLNSRRINQAIGHHLNRDEAARGRLQDRFRTRQIHDYETMRNNSSFGSENIPALAAVSNLAILTRLIQVRNLIQARNQIVRHG